MAPMLAWLPSLLLLLTGGQSVTSAPSATSGLPALHPMAAAEHAGGGGVGSLLPQAALAAAVVALDELQEDDDLLFDAEPEKEPQRPKLTRRQRRKKDVKTCAWAQLVEDEDLKDPTSITAKNFREDFRFPYCFFPRLVEVVKSKEWFPIVEHDAYGRPCHPVEHKQASTWIMMSTHGAALLAALALVAGMSRVETVAVANRTSSRFEGIELQLGLHHHAAPRVNVYVYHEPVFNNTDLIDCYVKTTGVVPWLHEDWDVAENVGEIWLHRALLEHPWRVLDPNDADLFFVPIYPFLSYHVLERMVRNRCPRKSHWRRMDAALSYLTRRSPYFKRFGGADHIVVCTWWKCVKAFSRRHRMVLRRSILGIYEFVDYWFDWGCLGREVTAPYVASSTITTPGVIGGVASEAERTIPFFFVGTSRKRVERKNLKVVKAQSPRSVIRLSRDEFDWKEDGTSYADKMTRSRFCFCPRGDTLSSRRFFDSVAAGCIPVITEDIVHVLPYLRTGLNYSDFTVIAPVGTFRDSEKVAALVQDLSSRTEEQLAPMLRSLRQAMGYLTYGITTGSRWADMHPFHDTTTRFLQEVMGPVANHTWDCPAQEYNKRDPSVLKWAHPSYPRNKSWVDFTPPEEERYRWLSESETIVVEKHSLLFCAPPSTGSLQFRMLAKRMQGVRHWTVSDDHALLFDPVASELPLLDVTNESLMNDIYKDINSGWITIGVVRDPVTRLLSLYLHLLQRMGRRSGHRRSLYDGLNWLERAEELRDRHEELGQEGLDLKQHRELDDGLKGHRSSEGGVVLPADVKAREKGAMGRSLAVPTFGQFVNTLEANISYAPATFRPMSRMCGMGLSHFDSIIPFETLQDTSTRVLRSLPNGIWDKYAASGWGPHGDHAFMEFDSGVPTLDEGSEEQEAAEYSDFIPSRARDLFEGGSCRWTYFYPSEEALLQVGRVYIEDYKMIGWYHIEDWIQRLHECLRDA